MKLHLVIIALVFCLQASAADFKSPLSKLALADGDCIVFLGDSLTKECLYTQYLETYFYTRYPSLRLRLHNAGVSGDTAENALARFDRDVAAYKPRYVTILLGMNDGAAKQFDVPLFDAYRANMEKLIGKIRDIGATPVLLTPTMYDLRATVINPKNDSRGRGGYYNGVLALYGAWLRETACDAGLGFVDFHGPLNNFTHLSRRADPTFTLVPDGIHPDANGAIIMAYTFVSDLGLSKRASTIDLTRDANGNAVAKVTGGKVSDARYNDDGVEFVFQPACLPMAVPVGAEKGAALIPLGHRMSYEALTIHGLPRGSYEMRINDQSAGVFTSNQLESHIELENNARTPQHQQAVRVAELNAQRNEQAVKPLRDLWRAQKTLSRTRRELEAAPGDVALTKRITAYERKLADFEAQLKTLEDKSREFEDRIYQENKPQVLRFVLVKKPG